MAMADDLDLAEESLDDVRQSVSAARQALLTRGAKRGKKSGVFVAPKMQARLLASRVHLARDVRRDSPSATADQVEALQRDLESIFGISPEYAAVELALTGDDDESMDDLAKSLGISDDVARQLRLKD